MGPIYYNKQWDKSDININVLTDSFDLIVRNKLCRLCDIQNCKCTTSNYKRRTVWYNKRGFRIS